MEWFKKHYDGAILLIAALAATAIAALTLLRVFAFEETFADRNSPKPRDNKVGQAEVADLKKAVESLGQHARWESHPGSLFVSRIYILKEDQLIDPVEGDTPLHPPVPNEWLLKHDLDYSRSDILSTDPDDDGFTVLEEFLAGTDPTDPESVPPYWTKLRLQEFKRIPFLVKFSGSPDGGETFTINYIDENTKREDPSKPTQFLTKGQQIPIAGQNFVLEEYTPKTETDPASGIQRDISELTLVNKSTGDKIVLINGKVIDSPTVFASFTNLLDGQTIGEIKLGETFSIPQDPETKYLLEEINEDRAVVVNQKTGEKIEIPGK